MPHDNASHQPRPHGPRGPQRTGSAGIPDGLLIGVLGFLLGVTLFTWTATGLAGLFSHGSWPEGVSFGRTPLAIRELATEPHDLKGAWPETPAGQLSGYGLFWGIFISQFMVLIVLTIFALGTITRARAVRQARRIARETGGDAERGGGRGGGYDGGHGGGGGGGRSTRDGSIGDGLSKDRPTPESPLAHRPEPGGLSAGGTPVERPASERPLADGPSVDGHFAEHPPRERPQQERPVAYSSGHPDHADPMDPAARRPADDTGPAYPSGAGAPAPASGPGAAPAPFPAQPGPLGAPGVPGAAQPGQDGQDAVTRVLEAPGAALVASPSATVWAATKAARSKLGPVHLFDPTHACDTPDRLRWSPHHGCADRATAAARAAALLAPLRSPRPIDATVHSSAETLLRCWLHAAALEDRPFREVHRWALASSPATDPVQTLRTHPKASSGSAGELEAVLTGHPQLRSDATALIRRALAPLSQLHVRNACTAARADRIAMESFINETGTLYVVGEDPDVLPILNALTQSVVEHGRRMAARSSAGRLDPPLTSIVELNVP
ncbi:hypothetical protein GCM10009801_81710 [Streptomyces albiaxialis]|uniref:Type VI secretion protein n=1 Tax=Streptomyces albiaxialis TaxID=329523 RepID=A0ABN2X5B7_9ACTN